MTELDKFLRFAKDAKYNFASWIGRGDDVSAYLRASCRFINGKKMSSLEIANVTVVEQGKGTFTKFLEEVESKCPYEIVFIENVFQERFQKFFIRRGYEFVLHSEPACYYKEIKHGASPRPAA
jgi:hypothetical protein